MQAISQTKWLTEYKIPPQKGSRFNYALNIIDTPGVRDFRDQGTIDQIKRLLSEQGEKGILNIDAVCFVVKATHTSFANSQKYMFHSIMSLFGKDIESNICTLITFTDCPEPPVLLCLKEASLPFGCSFIFNNSALFADSKPLTTSLSPIFWESMCKCFQSFFDQLIHFKTNSLSKTRNVLKEREQLKIVQASILPRVKAGLSKLGELRDQLEILKKYKDDIENNKDFEYEVEETRQHLEDLPPGQHVFNCLQCNVTCHGNCSCDFMSKCGGTFDSKGFCTVCFGKCNWSNHKKTCYLFTYYTEKVKKTYTEMKQRYEQVVSLKPIQEKYIKELTSNVEYLFENVKLIMEELKQCKSRLNEITLRQDPLSVVKHLNALVKSEETERQPGYIERIRILHEFKSMGLVDEEFQNFEQNLKLTQNDVTSAFGGKHTEYCN